MRKNAEAFRSIAERLGENKKSNGRGRAKEVKAVEEVDEGEGIKEAKEGVPPPAFFVRMSFQGSLSPLIL